VRERYEQHRAQTAMTLDQAFPEILDVLNGEATEKVRRAYIDGLRAKYHAYVALEPLRTPVAAVGPTRGAKQATVTIVEFADFECPFCRQMAPVISAVLDKYPNDVRLVFRQLPLEQLHPNAMRAAEASVCAEQQSKFWEMHDALFSGPVTLDEGGIRARAQRTGLDLETYTKCLMRGSARARIAEDVEAANAAGVQGTPGIFINGRFLNGAAPMELLTRIIDDEIERTRRSSTRTADAAH